MTINTVPPANGDDLIVGRAIMAANDADDDLQLWSFEHQGSDVYKILNVGDNTTLGVKDGWCGQFGDVQVGFDGTTSQWVLFKVSASAASGSYTIGIAFDDDCNFGSINSPVKAFDIDGGNSGAKIQTFDIDNTNPNQQFEIVEPSALSLATDLKVSELSALYNSAFKKIIVKSGNESIISEISLFDLSGKLIDLQPLSGSNYHEISASNLNSGIYILKIKSNTDELTTKLVVD